jgi:hypothetical protein
MKRALVTTAVAVGLLAPGASAARHYLRMANAPLVAKSYAAFLLRHGGHERCRAPSAYVVRCTGTTSVEEIRKLGRRTAEIREYRRGKLIGTGRIVDFDVPGWN